MAVDLENLNNEVSLWGARSLTLRLSTISVADQRAYFAF